MLRELVLSALASLLLGVLSAQFPELPYQMETQQEIAPMLSKYRTEHHALFGQLPAWLKGWKKGRKLSCFFQLLWWRKTIIQRNDFSSKAKFPWSHSFTRTREKNSMRFFSTFLSLYEPTLVLSFLSLKLLLSTDYLSINFALFTQLLFYSN